MAKHESVINKLYSFLSGEIYSEEDQMENTNQELETDNNKQNNEKCNIDNLKIKKNKKRKPRETMIITNCDPIHDYYCKEDTSPIPYKERILEPKNIETKSCTINISNNNNIPREMSTQQKDTKEIKTNFVPSQNPTTQVQPPKTHTEKEKHKPTEQPHEPINEKKQIEQPLHELAPENGETQQFLTYDEVSYNLKLLSRLGKGMKLLENEGSLDIENRWGTTLRRWFTSDSRESTYNLLKKILESVEYHSELLIIELKKPKSEKTQIEEDTKRNLHQLTLDLGASQVGFRNLVITYSDDDSFLSRLDILMDKAYTRKCKNLNWDK